MDGGVGRVGVGSVRTAEEDGGSPISASAERMVRATWSLTSPNRWDMSIPSVEGIPEGPGGERLADEVPAGTLMPTGSGRALALVSPSEVNISTE